MRPKPQLHPQGSAKVHEDAMREWIADAMQDAAERIEAAEARIATALATKPEKGAPCKYGHAWNWYGGGPTFCTRCGLETHS